MKVIILGGTGLLGADIIKACKKDYEITGLSSSDVDITDPDRVYNYIKTKKPEVVINSAAITDVDKCELEPDRAYSVNTMGPKNIAIACRDFKIKFIHISTDYVFNGKKGQPYTEFDEPDPVNIYGKTKLAGEQMIKEITNDFIILRTAWIFGEQRNHFVDYVVSCIKKGEEIIAVKDMVSSPTYSVDLAGMIKKLIPMKQAGLYHAANKGYCSRVQMVEEIMKIMKKQTKVKVVKQSQWERPAKRPVFSALRNYHLSLMDKDDMAGWRDSLKRYIKYKYES